MSTVSSSVDVIDDIDTLRYPHQVLDELTEFVLMRGTNLETQWLHEHRPDPNKHRCVTCNTVSDGGRCVFNRAATRARDIRLRIEERSWWN